MGISKIFIVVLFFGAFSVTKVYGINKADSLFKILKIKSKGGYYIVHAQRNDSLFKIISKKFLLVNKPNLSLLKKGLRYNFEFGKVGNEEIKIGAEPLRGIINNSDVKNNNVFVDGNTRIKFTKRFHYRLYTTRNLTGLYYSPL